MRSTPRIGTEEVLLSIRDLRVTFGTPEGQVMAVDGTSLDIHPGEVLAVVGESGSGKSQTALAVMGLLARNGTSEGSILWEGREILGLPEYQLARLRSEEIAMIFQNPMTCLNPYLRISTQMIEGMTMNRKVTRAQARSACIDMLETVQIADAANRIDMYPHEFSGGMLQRIMIAMSLLRRPRLLIADEPTTALDVTVQMQIVQMLQHIRQKYGTAIMLITHDLGLVASISDRISVMYSGQIMESGLAENVFSSPRHPYTQALLDAVPRIDRNDRKLRGITGEPPGPASRTSGCPFHLRCAFRMTSCVEHRPDMLGSREHAHACHLSNET
ncbi:MAG: ABC transporter ATP-binding protein [Gammaproteobacteria bacterium]|nr:ABC transporter ATP-binding protein [Gammaproteobacteria bacterium]